jgi:hypothetical protein
VLFIQVATKNLMDPAVKPPQPPEPHEGEPPRPDPSKSTPPPQNVPALIDIIVLPFGLVILSSALGVLLRVVLPGPVADTIGMIYIFGGWLALLGRRNPLRVYKLSMVAKTPAQVARFFLMVVLWPAIMAANRGPGAPR